MDRLGICNLALAKIGSARISSLTENSEEAKQCGIFMDQAINASLEEVNWPCANKIVLLTEDTTDTSLVYQYSYEYPDGALAIRRVTCLGEEQTDGPPNFKITNNSIGELRIHTDVFEAYAEITTSCFSVENVPPTLLEAITCRLAAELSVPVANNYNMREHMMKMYSTYLPRARMLAANQSRKEIVQNNRYKGARS